MSGVDAMSPESDKRMTTRIAKGLEIRSAGQITTKFLGLRVSMGDRPDKKKGVCDL